MPLNEGQRKARRQGVSESRVDQQPAFVLHTTAWRETSLIVEVLTRDFGRMGLVARGAKRPTSQFRGLLTPFSPIALSWSGRGDIKTLIRVDWLGGLSALRGDALLAAFYLNELLVRLLARADAHVALFSAYQRTLHDLAQADKDALEAGLRSFELDLLRETGWLPALEHTPQGEPIVADGLYRLDPNSGAHRVTQGGAPADPWVVSGAALHALVSRCWPDVKLATQCRHLLRALIAHHLDGRPLNTRRIFQDLKRL